MSLAIGKCRSSTPSSYAYTTNYNRSRVADVIPVSNATQRWGQATASNIDHRPPLGAFNGAEHVSRARGQSATVAECYITRESRQNTTFQLPQPRRPLRGTCTTLSLHLVGEPLTLQKPCGVGGFTSTSPASWRSGYNFPSIPCRCREAISPVCLRRLLMSVCGVCKS
jgi:hypothetical protein